MSRKVLVVDDEKLIVKGIRFSLEQDGMEVECAYDGEEALNMVRENEYDIILLDIMLPGLDGYALLECLRPQGVPVIFITAKGATKDRVRGLQLGADDYIVKPFEIEELLAREEAVLRRAGRGGPSCPGVDMKGEFLGPRAHRPKQPVLMTCTSPNRPFSSSSRFSSSMSAWEWEELQPVPPHTRMCVLAIAIGFCPPYSM